MVAKFRALTPNDYNELGSMVHSNTNIDSYNILDSNYLHSYDTDSIQQSLTKMNVRQVLKLTAPTFNFVLGRSNCTLLAKMLNISQDVWKQIVSFEVILDKEKNELVEVSNADESKEYLYGAEIAEYWIDKLDIEEAKLDCLYAAFDDFTKMGVRSRDFVNIDKVKGGLFLAAGYYAHFDEMELVKNLKRGRTLEDLKTKYSDVLFYNSDTRFSYLLNMNPDKSGLYGMLNYYIAIVPYELRPKIENQEHKLTKRYASVVRLNYELDLIKGRSQPQIVCAAYKALEKSVERLQYKNQGTSSDVKPDDLSVLERIKTKKGQIRMRNLGKRQDYSGRAVVCINPYLPLDVIRIPKSMLPKLLEYHILPYLAKNIKRNKYDIKMNNHISNLYDKLRLTNLQHPEAQAEMLRIIREEKLLDKIPIVLGRQPTLHKQSLQGFHVEISDLQAIEVNPLVCPAFNMDFDGDQGHAEVPLSPEAIKEVKDLIMTTQNLFLPKNGECTTEPRHEMLYGLFLCTRDTYVLGQSVVNEPFVDLEEARQAVINHKVKVWDTITVMSLGKKLLAGDAAFMACFPDGIISERNTQPVNGKLPIVQITSKTITKYINKMLETDSKGEFIYAIGTKYDTVNTFVGCINHLVETGFKVASLYPPNMSLLAKRNDISEYDNANEIFHKNMEDIDLMYNLGLEVDDVYKLEFDKHLSVLTNSKNANLKKRLGKDNGYVLLSESGARGSMDNLVQAFSLKGRVKKNSNEAFDAVLESSYASQLTPMEHFVGAFGGRQGQIDKSLKTGDTGYAMRQMWHATQGLSITCNDCGTTRGLKIDKKFLTLFSDVDSDKDTIQAEVRDTFIHTITGRYALNGNKIITRDEAERLANDPSVESIYIRSPLTCNKPCCQKCYGIDWSTHKLAVKGLSIDIIAAQSIGEPGTQLTLKQFQKGGVAGKAEMTSAFDKVNNYIHVANLAKLSSENKYAGYDPCAWATGKVIEKSTSDITMKSVSIEGCKGKKIIVPKDFILKQDAVKGEGLSFKHGDLDIQELKEYAGIEEAQRYLIFKLFSIYKSEVKIKMIHFEVLVSAMTRYMIVDTDRSDLYIGQYATAQELYSGNINNTRYIPRIIGVKKLPNASNDALDSIIMESQSEGLSRSCLLGLQDTLTKPINRMVLGQTINTGSAVPGFIENRKERI